MSQDTKSNDLENYLEGKSALSKLYADLPEVDIPKHLDAAILAEAHRVVGSRPGSKPKRRWTIPLGMVATLFVAVMVGLQLPYILQDATSPQQYKEDRVAAMMEKSMEERSSAVPEDSKKTLVMDKTMPKAKSANTSGAPATMPVEAEAPARHNAPALAVPSVATPTPATASKRMELRELEEIDRERMVSKEKKFSGQAQSNMSDTLEQRAPAAATMAAPAPMQLKRSLMQSSKDEASDAGLTPEEWLIKIKRLKEEGKLDEAKKELAAFKKRYPGYRVPETLELK